MPEHSPCYHSQELLVAIDTFDIFIWVTTQQNISSATFVVGYSSIVGTLSIKHIMCGNIFKIYYNPY